MHTFAIAEDLLHHAEMLMIVTNGATDQRVGFATVNHDRADHRSIADHCPLGLLLGDPPTFHDGVILVPVLLEARIGFIVDDLKVHARFNLQAQLLDTHLNHARTTNQDRFGQPQAHQLLSGVQDTRLLPFGQHHAFRICTRLGENRLHEQVGFVDELGQLIDIGVEVGDRARRHAGVHRRLRHRWRDFDNQAWIEGLRNDVVRAEAQILIAIGGGHHFALLRMGQLSNGMNRRQLHLFVNGSGTDIQRATEDEREAENVIHLVRVIRTAGADDGIRAHGFGQWRQDLRLRVCQSEDQRRTRHLHHHLFIQHFRA